MTEIGGLVWLGAGLGGLVLGGALAASCLRLRSPLEHALATYVLAWGWLVALTLALSPPELVTRGSLTIGIALGLVTAAAVWLRLGRPRPPASGAALTKLGDALRDPILFVLGLAVAAGVVYTCALAFLVPVNEGDALAYHVPRAALWNQEHGVGYLEHAVDRRLVVNPPNAEIGQLATIALSGSVRYVGVAQFLAYGALVLGVAVLAARIGLRPAERVFGALAFATLPLVVVQSSGALNDLVVASFLVAAAVFALRPGWGPLVLLALAVGLALGTKFTAILALPILAIVAAIARPPRDWPKLAAAGVAGIAVGSPWYLLNLARTGDADGGLADDAAQRAPLDLGSMATTALRLTLDVLDLSGAPPPYTLLFVAAGALLAALGLLRMRRSVREGAAFLAAGAVTASVYFVPDLADVGQRGVYRAWVVLGRPETTSFNSYWGLNVEADSTDSWFGPLGALLLSAGAVVAIVQWGRRRASTLALVFATAPWVFLLTLAVTIVWDPWRGRFLVFGIALAAATWGVLLRYRPAAATTAVLGVVSLGLVLANHEGKPSGLGVIWPRDREHHVSVRSVWGDDSRWQTQTRLRPLAGDDVPHRFVEEEVPADAKLAIVPRENEFLSPLFGPRAERRVSIVQHGQVVPDTAGWLVLSPGSTAARCPEAWVTSLDDQSGWRIERRVGPDGCPQPSAVR